MALFIFFGFEVGIRGIKAAGKGGISIRQKVAGIVEAGFARCNVAQALS